MSVETILGQKGREIITIGREQSLAQAAHLLAEKRIGAVVVSDGGGALQGILSERDIVRALARHGALALDAPVSAHMTADVVTCTRQAAVNDLMEIMTKGKFRHIPVVENGKLVGIISIGDVVKSRVAEIEAESQALKDYIATA
jgi:CBS domain-containing protein